MAEPTPDAWRAVDQYFTETLVGHDPALEAAIRDQNAAGLPPIEVAPVNAKFLHLLVRIAGARRVLEIGTLGAFSTIWMARALPPDGRVVTIEAEPRNAEVARANLERAGVGDRVEIRLGRGEDVLPTLAAEEPFDLVFIDADKQTYPDYYEEALVRTRRGGLILLDNVLASGYINAPDDQVPEGRRDSIAGLRAVNEKVAADERVDTAMVGIADGLMIARKR